MPMSSIDPQAFIYALNIDGAAISPDPAVGLSQNPGEVYDIIPFVVGAVDVATVNMTRFESSCGFTKSQQVGYRTDATEDGTLQAWYNFTFDAKTDNGERIYCLTVEVCLRWEDEKRNNWTRPYPGSPGGDCRWPR